ncbi:hypothetical protein [Ruegeria profundi]|uniref:hypothetical protein n=1 Tax=Ruegeria profundi TaxID=1685378 RepID=UPI001470176C|nr:hypothetical protein [Ruegeria profundi]
MDRRELAVVSSFVLRPLTWSSLMFGQDAARDGVWRDSYPPVTLAGVRLTLR